MSQNRSSAVMAQRVEPPDSLDFFPTPPWATRALCTYVIGQTAMNVAWDPACGDGAMARPLAEYFAHVHASDIHDYNWGHAIHNFLGDTDGWCPCDWIITNPPFRLAEEFVRRALTRTPKKGVALFTRTVFAESVGRFERLFRDRAPAFIAQFTERVVVHKGRLSADGSTATAYCWMVWTSNPSPVTEFCWIPPCRKALERLGDYPESAA